MPATIARSTSHVLVSAIPSLPILQTYGEKDWVPILLDGKEIGKLEVKALLP